MGWVEWLTASATGRIVATFGLHAPYGPAPLVGALLCSFAYYFWRRRARNRPASAKGFVRTIFAGRILLHPSSLLDMKLWALNTLAFAGAYGMLGVSGLAWRNVAVASLTALLGAHELSAWPVWSVLALCTILELLAYEFAYWGAHYLFHAVPSLWEFHKVHHSAEVLTTFTEMRTHPVEIIAFMNAIGAATGLVFGAMTYAFGPGAHPFTLLNGNIALMAFLITIGHLRHSHMWIPFTGWAGRLFQSPAHHQIHHSDDPKHFNTNLGFSLAVWDWLFGTLYLPRERETIRFGVGARHVDFASVARLYLLPFRRALERLRPEERSAAALPQPAEPVAQASERKLAA
jgi:sterol desaturase/sphingolipid hydroxylase (fatty acid hydroxylase superfamily)